MSRALTKLREAAPAKEDGPQSAHWQDNPGAGDTQPRCAEGGGTSAAPLELPSLELAAIAELASLEQWVRFRLLAEIPLHANGRAAGSPQ